MQLDVFVFCNRIRWVAVFFQAKWYDNSTLSWLTLRIFTTAFWLLLFELSVFFIICICSICIQVNGWVNSHDSEHIDRLVVVFSIWMSHAGVQEYFQIECRTRGSRSIFKLNVARGCPGVFSNWMSHAGVQEYFQINCRTWVSRSIFKLTVSCGWPEVFSNILSHAAVEEYFLIYCCTWLSRSIF